MQSDLIIHLTFEDAPPQGRYPTGLCKISLNAWYAGKHWARRALLKDICAADIKKQTGGLVIDRPCRVEYYYTFRKLPLDATNCGGMTKVIEDVLFVDDSYKLIKSVMNSTEKGAENKIEIRIYYL